MIVLPYDFIATCSTYSCRHFPLAYSTMASLPLAHLSIIVYILPLPVILIFLCRTTRRLFPFTPSASPLVFLFLPVHTLALTISLFQRAKRHPPAQPVRHLRIPLSFPSSSSQTPRVSGSPLNRNSPSGTFLFSFPSSSWSVVYAEQTPRESGSPLKQISRSGTFLSSFPSSSWPVVHSEQTPRESGSPLKQIIDGNSNSGRPNSELMTSGGLY